MGIATQMAFGDRQVINWKQKDYRHVSSQRFLEKKANRRNRLCRKVWQDVKDDGKFLVLLLVVLA